MTRTSTLPTTAWFIEGPGLRPSSTHQPLIDRSLALRGTVALLLANARYWLTVAPRVRRQLAHWQNVAHAIPDPILRELALSKLRQERFNVEMAATLATLAPAAHRARVTDAIVALEILYEYIDVLSERRGRDPDRLFAPLQAAFDGRTLEREDNETEVAHVDADSPYTTALADTIGSTLTCLPNGATVAQVAGLIAARCAEAQTLYHALDESGIEAARDWAALQPQHTDLEWQELLAGSCASVLGIHALIAAAADQATTGRQVQDLAELYLSIGALAMLDSLVDLDEDRATGQPGYLHYYRDPQLMATRLVHVTRTAIARARRLRDGPHHIVTLIGIVAYYSSAPTSSAQPARSVIQCVSRELEPLITPTLALMHVWRLAKRIRHRFAHQPPPPRVTTVDEGGPT